MNHEDDAEFPHPHPHHFRGPGGMGGPPGFGMRGGFGGPPWQAGFGPWPRGRGRGRGGRAKRGDVRAAALALLAEAPMNGYQIIQQISERSGGLWQPSPGSVYPALQQLEDEGLVTVRTDDEGGGGRRTFTLTAEGQEYVAAHAAELSAPWSAFESDEATSAAELHRLLRQLHLAAVGVLGAGTPAQIEQAREVLAGARRALYRILAEDEPAQPGRPEA